MPMPRKYRSREELLRARAGRYAQGRALYTPQKDPELFAPWPEGMWEGSPVSCMFQIGGVVIRGVLVNGSREAFLNRPVRAIKAGKYSEAVKLEGLDE